ncbi:amidohydrolase [Terriglobus roseus]|nr:amidohydrolase [Terriglobus roseus]
MQPDKGSIVGRRQFLSGALALASVASLPASAMMRDAKGSFVKAIPSRDGKATVVFTNGAVYTMNSKAPWAEAVAVNGDKIVAVGTSAEVKSSIGKRTEVIDLKGQMLLPGFVEGHTHPFLGAFFTSGVDLQYPTLEEALKEIKKYVAANPTGPLRGFGWRMDMFPKEGPTRQMLDEIVSDRPIMLFAIDVHSMWVNSKALEVAKITAKTPDPIPNFSYFVRDKNGEPTGFVLEVLAELMVANAVEPVTVQAMSAYLGKWLPNAAKAGITTLFDASVPPVSGDEGDIIQIYADYEAKGALPFRVSASHVVKGASGVAKAVAKTQGLARRFQSSLVNARTLKIVADGTEEGWTAYMLKPYTDKPNEVGTPPFTQQEMDTMVSSADLAGIDVHIHACGDATVRMALNAIEHTITTNPLRDRRNTIAHNVLVDDADLPRFAKLGVVSEFSPNWHSYDPDTTQILLERMGPERQGKIYRPNSILKAGGRISMGTDWPAAGYFSTYKPLDAIQIGVTRKLLDKTDADPCLQPESERLELSDALHANTLGAAYQLRMEKEIGSIQVGKCADLVVLAKNLFNVPKSEIAGTPVRMAMLNGRFTHREAF